MHDEHGGDLAVHPGIQLDFSVSLNPLGPPSAVIEAITMSSDAIPMYPDPYCRELRKALAGHHQVSADTIVCGNGSSDLIYRICNLLAPSQVLVTAPTFSEYERCAVLCGAQITRHLLDAHNTFDLDETFLDAMTDEIDLIFCCQPNNPTGRLVERSLLTRMISRAEGINAVLVIDECFLPFTGAESMIPAATQHPNLVIVQAFTKTYSMAGIRLGYAVTEDPHLASSLMNCGPRWNVSSLAQRAGLAALRVSGWEEATRAFVHEERCWIQRQLVDLGFEVIPSSANFVLFRTSLDIYTPLYQRGILIRSCQNFPGLDGTYWRIGLRSHRDNCILIDALRQVVRNG